MAVADAAVQAAAAADGVLRSAYMAKRRGGT